MGLVIGPTIAGLDAHMDLIPDEQTMVVQGVQGGHTAWEASNIAGTSGSNVTDGDTSDGRRFS